MMKSGRDRMLLTRLAAFCLLLVVAQAKREIIREVAGVIGNQARLHCDTDLHGQNLQVVWQDPNSQILSVNEDIRVDDTRLRVDNTYPREWTLVIENLRRSDEGQYICFFNTQPPETKKVKLVIHYPPTIVSGPPGEEAVNEGEYVELECQATGQPPPTVTWRRATLTGEMEEVHVGSKLVIQNVSRTDGGLYECTADNEVSPSVSKSVTLSVGFAPVITLPHQRISQQESKDTLLECIITANPAGQQYWMKDDMILEDSPKYRIYVWDVGENTRNLGAFVYDLQINDFGKYTCVAENENGRTEGDLYVHEYQTGDVRVHKVPSDLVVTAGEDTQIKCEVEGMSHENALIWWREYPKGQYERIFVSHPGNLLQEEIPHFNLDKYEIQGHYNLFIENVTFDDAGLYICEVYKHRNYTAHLTVVGSPLCGGNSTVTKGDQATLFCSMDLAGPAPNWRIDWKHRERKLSSVNLDTDSSLYRQVAFPARTDDEGVYTCEISSQKPVYKGSCSTDLAVDVVTSTANPYYRGRGGEIMGTYLALSIFGGALALLFLLFSCLLCSIVVHYRRKLVNCRENVPVKKFRNGHVSGDMEHMALNAELLDAEVSV